MKTTLFVLSLILVADQSQAQEAPKCNLFYTYKAKSLSHFANQTIKEKGYTFVKKRKHADFELKFQFGYSYGRLAEARVIHLETGMTKTSHIKEETYAKPDPLRSEMDEELKAARNIEEYKAVQKRWENVVFKDKPDLAAYENALSDLPSCESFYQ